MNDYKKVKQLIYFSLSSFLLLDPGSEIRDGKNQYTGQTSRISNTGEQGRYLLQISNLLEAEDINLMCIVWLRLVQAGHEVELLR